MCCGCISTSRPLKVCSDEYATEFEKERGNQAKEHNFENAAKTHNNSSD